ncbi:amidohydrolase [Klenkia sp. LSe6-5]|uniref:Amidohydrolase n=1 Tax=Klenkia sesuvii TaxID=3103137 RepID=A0ABU8DT54_9ACTN
MADHAVDLLLTGAVVHTLDPARPRASALAVRDGLLVAVGEDDELAGLAGPATTVVDLAGAVVLPGLMDVHNHHATAGEADLHQLLVPATAGIDELLAAVGRYAAGLEPGAWVVGESWGSGLIDQLGTPLVLAALDEVSAGHPVLLTDDSHHNKWANTAAMSAAGVLDLTADPTGGRVVRDASGAPTGVLIEAAGGLVQQAWAATVDRDAEYAARNSERGIELLHAHGITAFQDAAAGLETMAGLRKLDEEGRLHAWVVTSMLVNDFIFGTQVLGEQLLPQGERFRTRHHRPDFAKIFLDGVPTSRTGAFLEPYLPDEHGACTRGHTTMPVEELTGWLRRAAQLDIGLKIHCTGDASARMVLDVVAAGRAEGITVPVQIAHGQYLHPDDVPRFAELGVVADISPALWFPGVIVEALRTVRAEPQASRLQPNRDLLDTGALVAGGSDWPVAESPDPWPAIAGLVTRADPTGRFPGTVWPEQAITVQEAVAAYTTSAARAMGLADVTGALTPGLSADLVVLDRDPFAVPDTELASVTTLQTWFAGRQVFTRS